MHPQDLFLKLFVIDGIKDDYARSLVEEHLSFCSECTNKAAEFADQNAEIKLNVGELDTSVSLTKEEIAGLLKWRESPKILNELKKKDEFEDLVRKSVKTDATKIRIK
jgi:hypothetical protein